MGAFAMSKYAYLRVSSKTQHIDRQLKAILKQGVHKKNIYIDICSGSTFERTQYKKLLKKLSKGDILIIKSIDRLGRNYDEIIDQWRYLNKEKEVFISVLDMPILSSQNNESYLIRSFISDVLLQTLSFVAENELNEIHRRQKEGIQLAKEKGVKFGRPLLKKPNNYKLIANQYLKKEITSRVAANNLNVSQSTFLKWIKEENK